MNQLPSVSIEEGKKILLSINKTLTVLDVFDVNEDESCIDILFEPQLEWFDKSLTFKFLKYFWEFWQDLETWAELQSD